MMMQGLGQGLGQGSPVVGARPTERARGPPWARLGPVDQRNSGLSGTMQGKGAPSSMHETGVHKVGEPTTIEGPMEI